VNSDAPELLAMLKPYRDDALVAYRVSPEVNSNRASGPQLIEPFVLNPQVTLL
jgi:putative SOS response-associated peptidase YedK